MKPAAITILGMTAVLLNAGAQSPPPAPSESVLRREIEKIERERKAMFDPHNPAAQPRAGGFPAVGTPQPSQVDIEAVARRYEQKADARRVDGLMLFASFSMPAASLQRLTADAARVGAVVVLRGFKDGTIRQTALAVQALDIRSANIQINPNAFARYQVSGVPTTVLVKPGGDLAGEDGCALPANYVAVAGDVSLSHALEEIERRAPAFRDIAARYRRTLEGARQ